MFHINIIKRIANIPTNICQLSTGNNPKQEFGLAGSHEPIKHLLSFLSHPCYIHEAFYKRHLAKNTMNYSFSQTFVKTEKNGSK